MLLLADSTAFDCPLLSTANGIPKSLLCLIGQAIVPPQLELQGIDGVPHFLGEVL